MMDEVEFRNLAETALNALLQHLIAHEEAEDAGFEVEGGQGGLIHVLFEEPPGKFVITPNAPGKDAYPISSFTWMLVPLRSTDPAKGKVLKDLLSWIVNSGEGEVSSLSYAPLPKSVAEKVLKTVYSLQ